MSNPTSKTRVDEWLHSLERWLSYAGDWKPDDKAIARIIRERFEEPLPILEAVRAACNRVIEQTGGMACGIDFRALLKGLDRADVETTGRNKFDLAFEILRQLEAEQMDAMQSCHFGYVLRVERDCSAEKTSEPPFPYQRNPQGSDIMNTATEKTFCQHLRSELVADITELQDRFIRELRRCLNCAAEFKLHTSRPVKATWIRCEAVSPGTFSKRCQLGNGHDGSHIATEGGVTDKWTTENGEGSR